MWKGCEPGRFGRQYNELALVELKAGMVRMKLGEVVVRVPRNSVASAEVGDELMPSVTIGFVDGTQWRLAFAL
jgi:hypothetical protein